MSRPLRIVYGGISDAGVSILCRRVEESRFKDRKFSKQIDGIRELLIVET